MMKNTPSLSGLSVIINNSYFPYIDFWIQSTIKAVYFEESLIKSLNFTHSVLKLSFVFDNRMQFDKLDLKFV